MGKKVGIIGSGGREHAIGWSIAQSPDVNEVIYFPGNPGTEKELKSRNVALDVTKGSTLDEKLALFEVLANFVEKEEIDMVVVGPEQPLNDGIVNLFQSREYNNIFGPCLSGARIESDKFFSFDIMKEAKVPQARGIKCCSKEEAIDAIKEMTVPDTGSGSFGVVIKARGLTGGKGVSVCDTSEQALAELPIHLASFKSNHVLISERLFGQEVSVFGISDGNSVYPFQISIQDHKRLLDGDKGPNTGGMGAYGPVPIADTKMVKYIAEKMMTPVVRQMNKDGIVYKGFLYAGVIMTSSGPKILEFNCRLGDPETQPLMMMLKGGLYQPIRAALDGKLDDTMLESKQGAACTVVLASNGYPGDISKGYRIAGLEDVAEMPNIKVFHAGTACNRDEIIVTNGGRVLGVTAYSPQGVAQAQKEAYLAADHIAQQTLEANNRHIFIYRKDIAFQGIQ